MGGGSKQASESTSAPGTLSPITASLLSLFGGNVGVSGGQFVPTQFGGPGGVLGPGSFGALPGLLQNQPLSGAEQAILGARQGAPIQMTQFDQAGFNAALAASQPRRQGMGNWVAGGPVPNVQDFMRTTTQPGEQTFGGGLQDIALASALQGQGLLQRGAEVIPSLLEADPTAAIAQARRQFGQETLPAILERAPGFSSSDLQRELGRAGVDLETNIAALREAGLGQRLQTAATAIPQFTQALGTQLLDNASSILGFGQLGRELVREAGPAGDAFRVLTALQSLTGPGLTNVQLGTSKGKSTQVL